MRQQNTKLQLVYLFLAFGCAAVLTTGCEESGLDSEIGTNDGQIETEYSDTILDDDVMLDERDSADSDALFGDRPDAENVEPLSDPQDYQNTNLDPNANTDPNMDAEPGVSLQDDGIDSEASTGDEGSVTDDGIRNSDDVTDEVTEAESDAGAANNLQRDQNPQDAPTEPIFQSNKGTGSVQEQ